MVAWKQSRSNKSDWLAERYCESTGSIQSNKAFDHQSSRFFLQLNPVFLCALMSVRFVSFKCRCFCFFFYVSLRLPLFLRSRQKASSGKRRRMETEAPLDTQGTPPPPSCRPAAVSCWGVTAQAGDRSSSFLHVRAGPELPVRWPLWLMGASDCAERENLIWE